MALQSRLGLRRLASVKSASASAETISTRVRASAPSPDSTASINGDRHGLRAARDVAGHHQRDSEIAQRSREGQHRGGQDGAPRKGSVTRQKSFHSEAPRLRAARS